MLKLMLHQLTTFSTFINLSRSVYKLSIGNSLATTLFANPTISAWAFAMQSYHYIARHGS